MSIYPSTRVWDHSRQRGSPFVLLLAMADRADELGVCWAGSTWLANRARLERRQVLRIVHALEEAGEIDVIRSRRPDGLNTVNHYVIKVGATDEIVAAAHERVRELLEIRGSVIYDTSVTQDTTNTGGGVTEDTRGRDTMTLGVVVGMSPDPSLDPLEEERSIPSISADLLWPVALAEIEAQITRATFNQWLRGTAARWEGQMLVVTCRNADGAAWLTERLGDMARRAVESAAGAPFPVQFTV